MFTKKLRVWHPFPNFITAHELVPPPLLGSDVNGKVLPKLITTI